ncbi:uncharacterized protein LTR77_001757 [Saxophila tyrrhenica]|uniref:Uncharacterized protein n=1 Tax=Saxophila tyrrhenica TaxID=1690608 RepID=A0AAV9PLP3_9PEZI|nr:hypothetical protein LTR77_001757 [Saxophila tyrrhenica]
MAGNAAHGCRQMARSRLCWTHAYVAFCHWCENPIVYTNKYPAESISYRSLDEANLAAPRVVERVMREEHQSFVDADADGDEPIDLKLHAELFPIGDNDYQEVVQWDEATDEDGSIRSRAIYVNRDDALKVTAWVRRMHRDDFNRAIEEWKELCRQEKEAYEKDSAERAKHPQETDSEAAAALGCLSSWH